MKSLELELSGEELAVILGLSDRRIRQLADEGVVERGEERGRYRLHPSISRYAQTLEARRDPAVQELNQRKARLIEIEIAKRDGRLIELQEAEHVAERLTGTFIGALESLPTRIAGLVAGRSDMRKYTEARRKIEDIVDEIRGSLAEQFAEISKALDRGTSA